MTILTVATPGAGHVNPMMPLIEAFLAQGDEVAVAAGEDPGGVVVRSVATTQEVPSPRSRCGAALRHSGRTFGRSDRQASRVLPVEDLSPRTGRKRSEGSSCSTQSASWHC